MSRRAPRLSTRRPPPEPLFLKAPSRALTPCDSRHLPSTSARSTHRPLRDDESRTRARHRYSGFAALNPASDALSPPRSGEEVARPRPLPCALHARALLATRRSLTSAIETICKHDQRTSKPDHAYRPLDFRRAPHLARPVHISKRATDRFLSGNGSVEWEPRIHGSGAVCLHCNR